MQDTTAISGTSTSSRSCLGRSLQATTESGRAQFGRDRHRRVDIRAVRRRSVCSTYQITPCRSTYSRDRPFRTRSRCRCLSCVRLARTATGSPFHRTESTGDTSLRRSCRSRSVPAGEASRDVFGVASSGGGRRIGVVADGVRRTGCREPRHWISVRAAAGRAESPAPGEPDVERVLWPRCSTWR